MRNKILILVACSIAASPVWADRGERRSTNKHEAAGVGSGLAIGAAAGGPIGAIIGAAMGGWFGNKYHEERTGRLENEEELADVRESARDLEGMLQGSEQRVARLENEIRVEEQNYRRTLSEAINTQIFFHTAKAELDKASVANLERMAAILKSIDGFVIRVEGHADNRGDEEYNVALSAERASVVRDTLVSAGFPASRISVSAEGEAQSLAGEKDLDALALERKVHIQLFDTSDSERVAQQ